MQLYWYMVIKKPGSKLGFDPGFSVIKKLEGD